MQRQKKDGAKSSIAAIHRKQGGKVVLTLSDTFPSRQAAKRWIKKTGRDLKGKGAVDRAVAARHSKPWADVIREYFEASPERFGKAKAANLSYFQRLDFGKLAEEDTLDHDFFRLGQYLLIGVQVPPSDLQTDRPAHYLLKPRSHRPSPATWPPCGPKFELPPENRTVAEATV